MATLAAAATLLIAIGALLVLRDAPPRSRPEGFAARGVAPSGEQRALRIYRVRGSDVRPAGARVNRDGELAFAVRAAPKDRHLMIFGVDPTRRVFWFHPAWTDATANPKALSLKRGSSTHGSRWHEFRAAIRHDLVEGRLFVHALFLRRPLSVRQVERLVAAQQIVEGPLRLEGVDLVHALSVGPPVKESR